MTVEPVPGEFEALADLAPHHDQTTPPTGTDRLLTRPFVILWLCGFSYFFATGTISPLLPRFVKHNLGQSNVVVGLVVALLAVSAVVIRPLAGRMANQRGRRPVAVLGAFVVSISYFLYPVPHLAVLLPARLLSGVAEALFFTAATTMVTELAPESRRGEAVSIFSVGVYLGTGLGPAAGEAVTSQWSIGWGFVAAGGFGFLAAVLACLTTDSHEPLVAAVPTKRVNRVALLPGCVLALGLIGNVTFGSFMPLYADQIHTNPAGVYLSYTAVVILVRFLGARLPDLLGPRRCGTIATLCVAAGMATTSLTGTVAGLYIGSAILGVGSSFLYPCLMNLVVSRAPGHERASAVATFTAFFDMATGFGGLLVGVVASAGGYRVSFTTAAVTAMLSLVLLRAVVVRSEPCAEASSP